MAKIAFLFPGQGSQYVGMGKDLYETYPEAKAVYDQADELLGFKLSQLSFEGPEEELRKTLNTQPALLVHSAAVLAVLRTKKMRADIAAGHSLGEYSALLAAGSLSFEAALRLVRRRGELMWQEGTTNPGTMAAIIGLDEAAVIKLCQEVEGIVVPANFNEPTQIVVSGQVPAVERAMELARRRGALKVVRLPVSGAFHSPLLADSALRFREFLAQFEIGQPAFPVVANVTGELEQTAALVRSNLERQLTSPVRWTRTIQTMRTLGCERFYEVGAGKVLSGLVRRIDRAATSIPLGRVEELNALTSA
ncbi:MAG: ACP S-malonyltransferase [candidate division WOR-3 bacterium]